MKKEIVYNKEALNIISNLTSINQSIVFERHETDESKIVSKGSDANKSIVYVFESPKEVFDFAGEDCSFYNFNEFYTLFNIFEKPILIQNDYEIVVSENRSKINYRLTDIELIKKSFNSVKFENPDVTFTMDSELIKKIKTLAGGNNINAERIKFSVRDNILSYYLYNTKHHNTYEANIDIENSNDVEFEIEVDMRIWNKIPQADYRVSLKEEGIIELEMIREDSIVVKIYTADMEE